jgi:hypothetical protein
MSAITKLLPLVADNFSTQIASASVSTSALTFDVDDASDLPTEGVGQLFKKDADGNVVVGSIEFIHWTGVSGNTINLTDINDRGITGSDAGAQAYSADDYFEVWVSSYYQPYTPMIVEHGAGGTHDATKVAMLAGAQTITGAKTFTTGLLKAVDVTSGSGVSTLPTSTDTLVGRATTDTLTNKRITKRVVAVTTSATPTPNADTTDIYTVTALGEAAEFGAPTGTPTSGQGLIIRIKDDATARALTWNAIYRAVGATLPTTTVVSKTTYCGFFYNSADTKWDCVAVVTEA